jgi:hypothetical protein
MDTRKSTAQIKREIRDILAEETALFYPGGDGGGGSKRKRAGTPVVKPHQRTSSGCRECSRLHSMAQHAAHGGKSIAAGRPKESAKKKEDKERDRR